MQSEHHFRAKDNAFILLALSSAESLKQYNSTKLAIIHFGVGLLFCFPVICFFLISKISWQMMLSLTIVEKKSH